MVSSCSSPPGVPKRPGSPRAVGGGVFPIMADTGRLRQKGVPFSRLQVYEKGGISLVEVYEREGKSVIWVCERAQGAEQMNFMDF